MKRILLLVAVLIIPACVFAQTQQEAEEAYSIALKGVENINTGKYNDAAELFLKAMALDPRPVEYPYELALAYYMKKDHRKAVHVLDSLRTHPYVNEMVYVLLGNSHDFLEEKEKAQNIYLEGLEKFPGSGRLYKELGVLNFKNKKNSEVIGYWERGVQADPAFPHNYYFLSDAYSKTSEKVWAILYGENFLNLAERDNKFEVISSVVYYTYNNALFMPKSSGDTIIEFSTVRILSNLPIDSLDAPFQMAFQVVMEEIASDIIPKDSNFIGISTIYELRKKFIERWFRYGFNEKYPNIIFDYHKKLIDAGYFEAYTYWLLRGGAQQEFTDWTESHSAEYESFLKWHLNNKLEVSHDKCFNRFMYN